MAITSYGKITKFTIWNYKVETQTLPQLLACDYIDRLPADFAVSWSTRYEKDTLNCFLLWCKWKQGFFNMILLKMSNFTKSKCIYKVIKMTSKNWEMSSEVKGLVCERNNFSIIIFEINNVGCVRFLKLFEIPYAAN